MLGVSSQEEKRKKPERTWCWGHSGGEDEMEADDQLLKIKEVCVDISQQLVKYTLPVCHHTVSK